MATIDAKVLFCYVPHNRSMPAEVDSNTIYFVEDAQELWVGNKLIASHAESPTFNIVGSGDFIANAAYDSSTHTLTLTKSTLPVYTITKQQQADTGYSSTYQLFKDGVAVGDKINIPLDMVIENAEYKIVTVADEPYEGAEVGDPYLDFTVANAAQSHLYVPLKDLVDVYTGGTHITVTNNVINHDVQGSDTSTDLGQDGATAIHVSGQIEYDALGHVISVQDKNIYSAVVSVIDTEIDGKMDKISGSYEHSFLVADSDGNATQATSGDFDQNHIITGYGIQSGYIVEGAGGDSGTQVHDSQVRVSDVMTKIADAAGNKVVTSNNEGGVGESNISISDVMTKISNASGNKLVTSTATGAVQESNINAGDIVTTMAGNYLAAGYLITGYGDQVAPHRVHDGDGTIRMRLSDVMSKINNATGNKVAVSTSAGRVVESAVSVTDLEKLVITNDVADWSTGYMLGTSSNNNGPHAATATDIKAAEVVTTGYYLSGYVVAGDPEDETGHRLIATEIPISNFTNLIQGSTATGYIVVGNGDQAVTQGFAEDIILLTEDLRGGSEGQIVQVSDSGRIEPSNLNVSNVATVADLEALDLSSVGGTGYLIESVAQRDGQLLATAISLQSAVQENDPCPVTSGGVYTAMINAMPTWTVIS